MRSGDFTPRETVSELDRYIIGQAKAKRAVAIAMRNRWRRQQVPEELRDEIMPKNIVMVGPTGVGKTEIARRLAKLAQAPFLKIEASKFTEVGYVGRDVDSIVRDLVEVSVALVRQEERERVQTRAREHAEERLLDMLGGSNGASEMTTGGAFVVGAAGEARRAPSTGSREQLRERLRRGELDDETVEVEQAESASPLVSVLGGQGLEDMEIRLKEMLGNIPGMRGTPQQREVKVPDALRLFEDEEASKLIDPEATKQTAIERAEQSGIVFIDEIDKIAGARRESGPDVSREGVQRDLLPIIEGSTVTTRHGPVRTDHVLFIAAGAFHVSKVSDLIPELQGRFPIRVQLDSLDEADFVRILTEPRNALTKQYVALMQTEEVSLEFTPGAIEAIAQAAAEANRTAENIGARRLHTVMEALLDQLSFDAPERGGERVIIDAVDVTRVLDPLLAHQDLARFIL